MIVSRVGACAVVMFAALLSGCQTASIDTFQTSALGYAATSDVETGQSHFRQANYGLAEKHFRKAVEREGSRADAWLGLAASYDQLGRFDLADRAYDQLVKLAGRQPRILNNMGYSQYLRGNREKARILLLEASRGMADSPLVTANLALLEGA